MEPSHDNLFICNTLLLIYLTKRKSSFWILLLFFFFFLFHSICIHFHNLILYFSFHKNAFFILLLLYILDTYTYIRKTVAKISAIKMKPFFFPTISQIFHARLPNSNPSNCEKRMAFLANFFLEYTMSAHVCFIHQWFKKQNADKIEIFLLKKSKQLVFSKASTQYFSPWILDGPTSISIHLVQ